MASAYEFGGIAGICLHAPEHDASVPWDTLRTAALACAGDHCLVAGTNSACFLSDWLGGKRNLTNLIFCALVTAVDAHTPVK